VANRKPREGVVLGSQLKTTPPHSEPTRSRRHTASSRATSATHLSGMLCAEPMPECRPVCYLVTKCGLPNALVQLQAHYHHCGEAASEKCLSAATFVRQHEREHSPHALLEAEGQARPVSQAPLASANHRRPRTARITKRKNMSCLDGFAGGDPHREHFFSKLPLRFPPQTSHLVFE